MDDDLLADDGTYKDDGLDDLDIDAEAALLGLSDEELDDKRSANDDQELEYVDEDGNPVAIGENNADLYEVADIETEKLSNPADEDILELDLDTELDSFNQETTDVLDESPGPANINKSHNERQRKDNLISLTSRKEQERTVLKRRESRYSPEAEQNRQTKDVSVIHSSQSHSRGEQRDSYENEEFDEESEDESINDDHRERFKSERSNIITLTPAKKRTDIPDTLESVISVEETAKVQAFLENEQKRKMRFKGKPQGRMKGPSPRFQRQFFAGQQNQNFSSQQNQNFSAPQNQNFSAPQVQQSSQFSSPISTSTNQTTTTSAPQSRKILINPHFRGGVRLPPPAEPIPQLNETPQVSIPPSFEAPSYAPPVQYSHHDQVHSANIAPPPIYTVSPQTMQYKVPDYLPPPQQHMQQMPPPIWQPPDMTVPSYSNPPPVLNYGDPMPQQPPSYNNYNQNYPTVNYQNPPMPIPQTLNYSQPPPLVHLHSQSFPQPPMNTVSSSIPHSQYTPSSNPVTIQQMPVQSQPYQEQASVTQSQMSQHSMRNKFQQNQPRFSRPLEKRSSNMNIKHLPTKQPRLEHPQRKTNVHVNSSNIREIPLVDNLPKVRKVSANKVVPLVEDEDEKTKELRMKIEEQKLLREQILKRKEERRRQMASQRLIELKKRQAEQNRNSVTIVPKTMNQNNQMHVAQAEQSIMKPSVKERIGLPLKKPVLIAKKKIVVVRKKLPQNVNSGAPVAGQMPVSIGQRLKVPISVQKQNTQKTVKPTAVTSQQNNLSRPPPKTNVSTSNSAKPTAPLNLQTKTVIPASTPKSAPATASKKIVLTSHGQRGKALRFGNRPGFQQRHQFSQMQRMQRPRIPGLRGSQFPPPSHFMEHRMTFPGQGHPINDMRRHPPRFQEGPRPPHFQEPRPPLLSFHPPNEPGPFNHFYPPDMPFEPPNRGPPNRGPPNRGPPNSPPFRMRGPPGPNFRPRGMEPMYRDRFPPPQFQNQMQRMRPMFENNMQRFPRQHFHHQGRQKFHSNNASNSMQKQVHQPKIVQKTLVSSASPAQTVKQNADNNTGKNVDIKPASKVVLTRKSTPEDNKDIPKTQSVSVQNLSSSTSEAQLKKLCSSVGVVEMIQLIKPERKAIIKFKQPSQALNFQKKYQRYMLDLAMIQVSLLSA